MIRTYPKEEFQREYNILKSLLPDGLYDLLHRMEVTVAGGTLTSLFSNREVNDLDLYFRTWDDLEVFLAYMSDQGLREGDHDLTSATKGFNHVKRAYRYFKNLDAPGSFQESPPKLQVIPDNTDEWEEFDDQFQAADVGYVRNVGMTDKSVMFSNHKTPVIQCIAFDVFDCSQAIFDKFDFTINMGAFNFKTELWEFDQNFLKHLAQKVLVLNPDTDYPIISMLRASKYQARGYTISRRETMKLGLAASCLDIASWDDAKAQLSGMYGTNVEELFSTDEMFSFSRLFDKLDSAGDKIISSIATEKEKGEYTSFNLEPVQYFTMLQRLRRAGGRPYFDKLYGVCASEDFYLLTPHQPKHSIRILSDSHEKDSTLLNKVNLYLTEEEARADYTHRGETGQARSNGWVQYKAVGACLLDISITDPTALRLLEEEVKVIDKQKEKTKIVVENLIEANGDIS